MDFILQKLMTIVSVQYVAVQDFRTSHKEEYFLVDIRHEESGYDKNDWNEQYLNEATFSLREKMQTDEVLCSRKLTSRLTFDIAPEVMVEECQ